MNKDAITWLYRQLPELVAKGILTPENAEQIKAYYGPAEQKTGPKAFLLIFGIIGAVLIGLGIILILAHNWASISRGNRLLISVGLLGIAQLISGIAFYCKRDSKPWRESTALLHMLMIGAAMALVGQTYHLADDMDAFLLSWMALSLPLIYLLNVSGVSLLYLIGITAWSATSHVFLEKQLVWLLLLLFVPYYWREMKRDSSTNAAAILSWGLNICLYFCFAASFDRYINAYGLLIYSSLLALNYLTGVLLVKPTQFNRLPFKLVGLTGSIGLVFTLTFNTFWRNLATPRSTSAVEIVLVGSLVLLVLAGNSILVRRANKKLLAFSLAPLFVGGAYLLQWFDTSGTSSTLLMNAYMLALAIGIISAGLRTCRIGTVNLGMVLLALLIIARFLDANFSFVTRGLVFMLVGIGFLATNLIMLRRKAGEQHEN